MTTPAQAYAALRRAGATPAEATLLTAIGGAESGWNVAAVGDVNLETAKWGPSFGVWQVRTLKAETGKGTVRDIARLRTGIDAQAAAAVAILRGSGARAWSTYSSGAYTGYLTQAKRSAGRASSSTANPGSTTPGVDPGPGAASNVGLFPGGNLDPLNWPGAVAGSLLGGAAGAAAGAAGGAAGAVAQGLWSQVQPFLLTGMFAVGGIALVIIGLQITARPVTDRVAAGAEQAAQTAGTVAMVAA